MKIFLKALFKSLFGGWFNTISVGVVLGLAILLIEVGEIDLVGWTMSGLLVLALGWQARRYG